MDAIQYFYQIYIEYLRNLLRISESADLPQEFGTAYYSLNGIDYFQFLSPFLVLFTLFLLFFVSVASAVLALCCFCFFLPLFFTIFSIFLVIAYHFTVSVGDHILEVFH